LNDFDNFDSITCRLAIQLCIGRSPSGRARHRTINIKNINPNAEISALNALVRAIAPLLAYPITKVRLVTKKIRVLFDVRREAEEARESEKITQPQQTEAIEAIEPVKPAGPAEKFRSFLVFPRAIFHSLNERAASFFIDLAEYKTQRLRYCHFWHYKRRRVGW
jgi:hypothetical protein